MLVGQICHIADRKAWTSPTGLAAVSRVVGKTDTRTQRSIAVGIITMAELVHIAESMCGIVVIVGGIPNGGPTHSDTPAAVFTGNE